MSVLGYLGDPCTNSPDCPHDYPVIKQTSTDTGCMFCKSVRICWWYDFTFSIRACATESH